MAYLIFFVMGEEAMKRIFKWGVNLSVVAGILFCFISASHAEPYLYQIYNTLYGTSLTSDAQLLDTYGKACSDTGDPCTQDADCTAGTCAPIDDQVFFLETDGYVRATARYAGYSQLFGWYSDLCIGSGSNYTWYPLFNVTDSDYLYRCTVTNTPCIDTNDCPAGQTCQSVSGKDTMSIFSLWVVNPSSDFLMMPPAVRFGTARIF